MRRETGLSPPVKYFTDRSNAVLFVDHLCVFVSCVSRAFVSVHCCLVVTCWESADLLALVGDVYCIFVTLPCGILWYLIVSFPDLCRLSFLTHYITVLSNNYGHIDALRYKPRLSQHFF